MTSVSTLPPERPTLTLDPPVGAPGEVVTATGNGYTPDDAVSVIFDHTSLSSVTVEPDGSFQTNFIVPDMEADHYVVDAIDESAQVGVNVFTLTFEADLNRDETVNILDISIVAMAFGTKEGDPNYNPIADLDDDKQINILDISTVAMDYGKTV